jgi:hypothetical protein
MCRLSRKLYNDGEKPAEGANEANQGMDPIVHRQLLLRPPCQEGFFFINTASQAKPPSQHT